MNITPENVWAVLDDVKNDFEGDLADVMEAQTQNLRLSMNRKTMMKTKIKKPIRPFQTQINLYTQLYSTRLKIMTLTFKMNKSMSPVILWTVLLKAKMIP